MNIIQFTIGLTLVIGLAIILRNVNWRNELTDFTNLVKSLKGVKKS